jgi:uncharacterized membrane protein
VNRTSAHAKNPPHIWKPVRQRRADTYLLTLIAIYGITVILVRSYLEMTGYPQVGDSTYHIAHLLWGGLFMFVAMVLLLIWANPWLLSLTAVMGGIGAGLFIDEVGKFITQKNDYFFPLALPIIYALTLVGVWLYFRMRRSLPRDSRTLLYHALQDLKQVLDRDVDSVEYAELVQTLNQAKTVATDQGQADLAQALLAFVQSRPFEIEGELDWSDRIALDVRRWFLRYPPRRVLKSLLIGSLLLVSFLAGIKLAGLFTIAGDTGVALSAALSNYVIVSGKSSYEVHHPDLLMLHTMFIAVTGLLTLAGAILLLVGRDKVGLRVGILGLVLALTVVNLLTFYFSQLYATVDALVQLAAIGMAQLYRWRFLLVQPGHSPLPAPNAGGSSAHETIAEGGG